MRLVHAQCADAEIRLLRGTQISNGGWALRLLMRFDLDGRTHEATPGRFGFYFMGTEARAQRLAQQLRAQASVALLVDPRDPQRAYLKRLPTRP